MEQIYFAVSINDCKNPSANAYTLGKTSGKMINKNPITIIAMPKNMTERPLVLAI